LAEAGYPNGFEVGMDCPNDRYVNDGQICQAVNQTWSQFLSGATQCGLTLTGINFGFGGLGGGLSCPKLTFGGGGPPIGSIGIGAGGSGSGLYINGTIQAPPGYTLPANAQGTF
ncbi:MAG: hypothetical protein J0H14_01300, partial [Alphaproteobacteria bacterium]|nr:hypothetical protein [Alphaproteobacteria bacterium]